MPHSSTHIRKLSTGLILLFTLATASGCNQNPPPTAEKTPPAASQTGSAPANNLISNVPVKGNEALPPSHPPLPPTAFAPTRPIDAENRSDLNQLIAAEHPKATGTKTCRCSA